MANASKIRQFNVGDRVTFTNSYGAKFPGHVVMGFRVPEGDFLPDNTVYIDSDSPWFPVKPSTLALEAEVNS